MESNLNGHLPLDRLDRLDNFGHSMMSASYLYRPTRTEQVAELFELARQRGTPVTFRGSGRSYGDASLNAGGIVVDIRRMNRILEWNPETGVIKMEPGVTIQQLWQHILEDGWWPPVVPGTMLPTIGGCLGTNVHGKNNWQRGTFGEQVIEFTVLLPTGQEVTCTPDDEGSLIGGKAPTPQNLDFSRQIPKSHDELFYAVISSLGMLGMVASVTMQMKRVYSGNLWVSAWTEPGLERMLAAADRGKDENDYVVGWLDCTAGGGRLGRGQMHSADYLAPGEDPAPAQTLRIDRQALPDTFFGLVPKSILYKFMRPFMSNPGVWAINTTKYLANNTIGNHKRCQQSHVAFNFLLNYIPNWELSYGRGGMIQYQCFIPKETAFDAFTEMIKLGLKRRLPSYLGVLKRHRPDKFLLTHAVDGYSFAQDYRVAKSNRIVLEAGGRFYFAKDSTISSETVHAFMGEERIQKFRTLKAICDPDGVLESDLYRRCFGPPPYCQ
ncbi:MAG: FAD-dependent oxidoreductase [Anaerolineales bacterium]